MYHRKTRSKAEQEPVRCEVCGAWIFTLPHLHAMVCPLYREVPEMVRASEGYYSYLLVELEKKKALGSVDEKPKKTRKKREKNTGLQTEKRAR